MTFRLSQSAGSLEYLGTNFSKGLLVCSADGVANRGPLTNFTKVAQLGRVQDVHGPTSST